MNIFLEHDIVIKMLSQIILERKKYRRKMVWSEKLEKQWLEMELNIRRCFTNPENGKDNKSLLIKSNHSGA